MPRGEQRRPVAPRSFYRLPNRAVDPLDERTMIPTPPQFLVRQGPTGLFGAEDIMVDSRRGARSFDQPGYMGQLDQPVTDP